MPRFTDEKEKLLRCLERFDNNTTVEDVTDCVSPNTANHTLLLHILLEAFCSMIEKDHRKRLQLFNNLCKRMVEEKLLDEHIALDNFMKIRRDFASEFFQLAKQVQASIVPDDPIQDIPYIDLGYESIRSNPRRYEETFREIDVIAEGGFGLVTKARHKVDGITYAVKKIVFKYRNDQAFSKVNREVRNIATLDHPNIVRYNDAWFEPYQKSNDKNNWEEASNNDDNSEDSSDDSERSSNLAESSDRFGSYEGSSVDTINRLSQSSNSTLDSFIVFSTTEEAKESNRCLETTNLKGRFSDKSYTTVHSVSESLSNASSRITSNSGIEFSEGSVISDGTSTESFSITKKLNLQFSVKVVLFIQMEYCQCDLHQWLDRRAKGVSLPFVKDELDIFRDILNGVVHIHARSIIHRDLKPKNIFYSEKRNILKIGDFGLATLGGSCFSPEQSKESSNLYHSSELGTVPYAAPEQIGTNNYDCKVDMYSLGIILIELLLQFKTAMELNKTVEKIKLTGEIPQDLVNKWPDYVSLVQNLVSIEPSHRMPANQVLKLPLIGGNNEEQWIDREPLFNEIKDLKAALNEKEETVKRLMQRIEEQDLIIDQQRQEIEKCRMTQKT